MKFKQIKFRVHAIQRMFERKITFAEVMEVISNGETIEEYPEDKPYPSILMLGFVQGKPLHLVLGINKEEDTGIVITAYRPDPAFWQEGFRRRKNNEVRNL